MKRRDLIKAVMSVIAAQSLSIPAVSATTQPPSSTSPNKSKMPVLFIGHGSPMNALRDNAFTQHLTTLGKTLPTPRAILVVSAHWVAHKPTLTASLKPSTIYDFGGFPDELYQVKYPCAGSPVLAEQVAKKLSEYQGSLDLSRGLDHGAWTVLHHLYPQANIPVVQLAMGASLPIEEHVELAAALQALRSEGVLILGSGNIVHNLRRLDRSAQPTTPDWASEFDETIKAALLQRDYEQLLAKDKSKHPLWGLSHPTIEHYVPLLYSLGATTEEDQITFPHEGFASGSISMRSVMFG